MEYNVITLDDKDYVIVSEINIDGQNYLYVVSEDDENESFSILRKFEHDGSVMVESLDDDEEIEMVLEEISKRDN